MQPKTGKSLLARIFRAPVPMLDRQPLCSGKATRQHLEELERLAVQVGAGSLCGLGKTAPNPARDVARYRAEDRGPRGLPPRTVLAIPPLVTMPHTTRVSMPDFFSTITAAGVSL